MVESGGVVRQRCGPVRPRPDRRRPCNAVQKDGRSFARMAYVHEAIVAETMRIDLIGREIARARKTWPGVGCVRVWVGAGGIPIASGQCLHGKHWKRTGSKGTS